MKDYVIIVCLYDAFMLAAFLCGGTVFNSYGKNVCNMPLE
jgi:hypothetical protein